MVINYYKHKITPMKILYLPQGNLDTSINSVRLKKKFQTMCVSSDPGSFIGHSIQLHTFQS